MTSEPTRRAYGNGTKPQSGLHKRYPLQIAAPETEEKFFAVIELVLDHFQLFVEEQTFTKQPGFWPDTTNGKPP